MMPKTFDEYEVSTKQGCVVGVGVEEFEEF